MATFVKDKLANVKLAETEVLRAKAEYVYETCKAIIETGSDRAWECDDFINKIYEQALKINKDI